MRRGQIQVRAIKAEGKWGNVDALDLDEGSFRAFVLQRLYIAGLVVSLPEGLSGEEVILKERKDE